MLLTTRCRTDKHDDSTVARAKRLDATCDHRNRAKVAGNTRSLRSRYCTFEKLSMIPRNTIKDLRIGDFWTTIKKSNLGLPLTNINQDCHLTTCNLLVEVSETY